MDQNTENNIGCITNVLIGVGVLAFLGFVGYVIYLSLHAAGII